MYNTKLDDFLTKIIKIALSPLLWVLPEPRTSKKTMEELSKEPPLVIVDFNFLVRKALGTLTEDEKKIVYNADASERHITGRLKPEEEMKLVVDAVGLKYYTVNPTKP